MTFAELVLHLLEWIGVVAFAISGAMAAIHKRVDLFGVLLMGVITALGGGVVRDTLLGELPPRMFATPEFVLVAALTAAVVFLIAKRFKREFRDRAALIESINNVFDAAGLGAFTVTGARVAMAAGHDGAFFVICLGVITGIGGGVLRDIMIQEIPMVLRKHIYAVASILGGCVYFYSIRFGVNGTLAAFVSVLVVFTIRLMATLFRWNLPRAE